MPLSVPLRIRSSSNKMKASQKHSYPALKTAYSSPLAKRDIFQVTSSGTRIYASCGSEYWSKIDTTIKLGRNFIVDEFSNLCGNKILFYFTMFVWTHGSHAFSILKHDVRNQIRWETNRTTISVLRMVKLVMLTSWNTIK